MPSLRFPTWLRARCLLSVTWLAMALATARALAEDAGAPDSPAQVQASPALTPPAVAQGVEATYPPAALAQGLSAQVELLVTVAVDGSVVGAEVVTPAGHGFDEAARDALLRFRFEPARKDGQPIAARIRYRYQFTPPTPPPPAPVTTGRLAGKVLAERDQLLAGAEISVIDASAQTRSVTSDAQGAFALEDLAPGRYQVQVFHPEFLSATFEEVVASGEETQVTYRVTRKPLADTAQYEARAVVQAPTREVTRRALDRETMYRVPGTGNDPIRSVEVLPGVSRPPFGTGQLIIRGSSPEDSQTFVDGMPIPQLYHFGGLRSVYNAQLLRQIELYPGNFSSRYGRKTGGVFELTTRDPATDRLHGVIDVSPIDGSILLEGPLSRRFSLAASLRRSLFDLVMRALAAGGAETGFTALPAYYDYQVLGSYRGARDHLRLSFYGSNDHVGLLAADEREANVSEAANAVDATARFNFLQLAWKRALGERTDQVVTLQAGPTLTDVSAGQDFRLRLHVLQIQGRAEWLTRIGGNLRLIHGLDIGTGAYRAEYRGPSFGQTEGNPSEDAGGEDEIGAKVSGGLFQPGAYTELGIDLGPVTLNGALRGDYYQEIRSYSLDPRLVSEVRLHPQWTLKLGAGLYSQPPAPQESHPAVGNDELDPIRSAQFSSGLTYQPYEGVKLGVEGFYKNIWDNVVAGRDGDAKFVNEGKGRIYGLEASAQVQPVNARYAGILSYTLLESQRKDHLGEAFRRFDYQQTHGLSLALLYIWPRGWDLGLAARYFTGNPYTPVVGRVFNTTERSYRPVYGAVNSERNPAFNRFDVRIQKTWKASRHSTTLYLDVQNVLNQKNQEAFFYNYDFTRKGVVNGLPVIPALGVRGQF